VERSELLLKLLSNRETGAFVAAPTTSLPEWPGGPRNWDYRYAWVRDAAFAAQSLLLLGHVREAREYVRWVVGRFSAAGTGGLATMYRANGEPVDRERLLDHWEGHDGSRPVRIGNAAGDQTQLDIYGEVLDAAEQLAPADPEFVRRAWPVLSQLVDAAVERWTGPDAGIWESRSAPAHYVHSKVMCWVAVDRGRRIAERLGHARRAVNWQRVAEAIHRTVLQQGYDEARGTFVQAFDRRELDASVLRIPMTGFLPFDDPRVTSTVRVVERELGVGPFVYRYRAADSLHGPEGAFLLCSFWLVECLARSGETERAVRIFRKLLKIASPLRLFPEEFDPRAWRPLGNYPQAFTHIGVLRAALAIGADPSVTGARRAGGHSPG
jgi:GH15 family glucan-1,4-alpha-glucosidase